MIKILGVLIAPCAIAWMYDWATSLKIVSIVASSVAICYHRWIYVAILTAPRDLKAIYYYAKLLWLSRYYTKKNMSIADIFHENVKKYPNKACMLFEDETWSFKEIEEFSLRVSAVLKKQGVKKGDVVAVMLNNCPEYPATWLGIARLGAVAALINTNQTGNTLLHSIKIVNCNFIIYGSEFETAFQDISNELDSKTKLFKYTRRPLHSSDSVEASPSDFATLLKNTPPTPWFLSEGDGPNSNIIYIYTSGTTGLPKAAVISSSRLVFLTATYYFAELSKSDVVYTPMPLYHSAGGCSATGIAIVHGCTVAVRTKFSASTYFKDCAKYNATASQYIGEMCRYILATPPSPADKQHKVRVVFGYGMRAAIWTDFVERFNIKKVCELYGATEGNANVVNVDNKVGSIGFMSRIFPNLYPTAIIKVDEEGNPIRNTKGLCELAKPGEAGVFIGKINPKLASRSFLGYVDKSASEKKIVRDVFEHGDAAFLSGDILIADELGYLYFRDRSGDTYRWRGENVSTAEVEGTISKFIDQKDAVVYGVEIPNIEGRAGMCGIVDLTGSLDLDKLAKDMAKDLPKYARPIFIRIMTSVDMTGTYKMRKVDLVKEGFNPNLVTDKLFYFESKLNKYVPLEQKEYDDIVSGKIRL